MAATTESTTILAEDVATSDVVWDGDRPIVDPAQLEAILGWDLTADGLCRGDACVLVPDRSALDHPDGVDLAAVAGALGRPVLVDSGARMVAVGAPASERHKALLYRQAPDATLLDLHGARRRLSEWSGTRRLLVAFSSW